MVEFKVDEKNHFPDEIQCPKCRHGFMHHHTVNLYNRAEEDDPTGVHVRARAKGLEINRSMVGNPSYRRDGLTIALECEQCGNTSVLNIYQHKGVTYIGWEGK
jgi:ribosomal protein S27AE